MLMGKTPWKGLPRAAAAEGAGPRTGGMRFPFLWSLVESVGHRIMEWHPGPAPPPTTPSPQTGASTGSPGGSGCAGVALRGH